MEPQNIKEQEVQIQLLSVLEKEFSIDSSCKKKSTKIDNSKLFINFGFNIKLYVEKCQFTLLVSTTYTYKENNSDKILLKAVTENNFRINDMSRIIKMENDNQINDSYGIVPVLVGISISTLRGVLVARTQKTVLSPFPLPIVNPTDMVRRKKTIGKQKSSFN